MSQLSQLQDAFQRYMLHGEADIGQQVVGTARVPVQTRLAIYGDGYILRLLEALQATFPALAALAGADFERIGSHYIRTHESRFFSIRYYGDQLPQFLASDPQYAAVPILAELARWEWAMAAVFDATDRVPLKVGDLAALDPEHWAELRFECTPALAVLQLEWNVAELWKAVTEQTERPEPELLPEPGSWLLWRDGLQIYFRPLPQLEAQALAAVQGGQTFGELCELLCAHLAENEASRRAAGYLRGWVESGLIVGATATPA